MPSMRNVAIQYFYRRVAKYRHACVAFCRLFADYSYNEISCISLTNFRRTSDCLGSVAVFWRTIRVGELITARWPTKNIRNWLPWIGRDLEKRSNRYFSTRAMDNISTWCIAPISPTLGKVLTCMCRFPPSISRLFFQISIYFFQRHPCGSPLRRLVHRPSGRSSTADTQLIRFTDMRRRLWWCNSWVDRCFAQISARSLNCFFAIQQNWSAIKNQIGRSTKSREFRPSTEAV